MVLRSTQFDDIYFSPEDGLAETRFVFLEGNNLPEAWAGREQFVIAETGFGTGLNFLASWALFEKTALPDQKLHFISFEKYPLSKAQIEGALSEWRDDLGVKLDQLLALYPLRVPGFHRIDLSRQVSLTVVFDDVNEALPQLIVPQGVDAWFLDGFAPAKNPDMWTPLLFEQMARLSHKGTSFATFTAAGAVRRGLTDVGFAVEKVPGYGRKRERLVGVFEQGEERGSPTKSVGKRVAIIGGGAAGCSAAYVLKRRGYDPVLYESEESVGSKASGNRTGLFNPRISAHRTAESDLYVASFSQVVRTLKKVQVQDGVDVAYNPCGNLHLVTDEDRERRLKGVLENWGWHKDHARYLDQEQTSVYAGADLPYAALLLPDAGDVSPAKLCTAYVTDIDVRVNHKVEKWERIEEGDGWLVDGEAYDFVILAGGAALENMEDTMPFLPIGVVRGQVTKLENLEPVKSLKCNLCYGGYITVPYEGSNIVGSTFTRDNSDESLWDDDHDINLEKLRAVFPDLGDAKICGGKAGVRVATNDRSPLIGSVPDYQNWKDGGTDNVPGLYVSAAHGSHGMVTSLTGAHLIADMIEGVPYSLGQKTLEHILPERFLKRARRRGKL